jgi:hypothetical protein
LLAEYIIRYRALIVVFLVYPATLLEIRERRGIKPVSKAWVRE